MIDRNRRDRLALHIRQYATGRVWNTDFETRLMDDVSDGDHLADYARSCPEHPDPVIPSMLEHAWCLRFVNPAVDRISDLVALALRIFGVAEYHLPVQFDVKSWDDFTQYGDYEYWPFLNRREYERELAKPKYFTGKSAT